MLISISILVSVVLFTIIYKNKKIICSNLKLFDLPDKKLKLHKKKIPIIGGIILNLTTILNILILIFAKETYLIKILLFSNFCSLIGILDDIYDIKPKFKFFFITIIILFFLIIFPDLRINNISFNNYFFQKEIDISNKIYVNIFFTILSYQLLINSFNMSDGHDGVACLMAVSWFIYLQIFKISLIFLLPIIISHLLFTYFNLKSRVFLGDSGNYFLSTLIGSLIIFANNTNKNIFAEEIFILLMLPGIDMMRLFFIRILNKKNPLNGDRNHFHHLLFNKFSKKTTILIYFIIFITPIILLSFKILLLTQIIIIFILTYFISLFFLKK